MVVWLIGLSASGKTTMGTRLYELLKPKLPNLVLLDGDQVRQMLGNDLGHSLEDRRRNADRICKMGAFLDRQGIHVITCILSIFPESRAWNRENLEDYYEIYVRVPLDKLRKRETKGIYRRFDAGEISGVAGLDLPFAEPESPDLIVDNSKDRGSVDPLVRSILVGLKERGLDASLDPLIEELPSE